MFLHPQRKQCLRKQRFVFELQRQKRIVQHRAVVHMDYLDRNVPVC